jgi:hypothetical protein
MEQMMERLLAKMDAGQDERRDEDLARRDDGLPRNDGGMSGE